VLIALGSVLIALGLVLIALATGSLVTGGYGDARVADAACSLPACLAAPADG
jgi:hypothetical protein